jgi:hypothetical protein
MTGSWISRHGFLEERARADLYRAANDDLFVAEDVEVGA